MPLLVLGAAWLGGIFLGPWTRPPLPLLVGLAIAAGAAALWWGGRRPDLIGALALVAFLLGVARHELHTRVLAAQDLSPYFGSAVAVMGMVDEEPEQRSRSQRLVVAVRALEQDGRETVASGRVLVTLPPLPERRYGDLLRLSGRLETPPAFPGFDYRDYLYRQGISAVMGFPRVQLQAAQQGSGARAALISLRQRLAAGLAAQLPEPHAALAQGIVLGQRSGIPPDLAAAFARTGTAHLLAVSGQNLTLAAALAVAWGSRVFGRRHPLYYLAVLGCLWGYAVLVGLAPSVLRAALMATLMVVGAGLGRQGGGPAALVAAAALMAAYDPLIVWEVSFRLSFLALAGVLFLAPVLELLAWRLPGLRTLSQQDGIGRTSTAFAIAGLAATLGAALATLPVVWGSFGTVPVLALPATVFALPAFPVIMGAGAFTAGAAVAQLPLATPLAWVTWGGTAWLQAVVQAWAEVPGAALTMVSPPPAVGWTYTAVLFALMAGVHRRWYRSLWRPHAPRGASSWLSIARRLQRAVRPPLLVGVVLAVAILVTGWGCPERGLRLWFLDAGGDAVLLRTAGGATILVGGSPDPGALLRALGRVLPFGQRSLDLVLLPSPDREHLPGLLQVLARYGVGQVMETEATATTQDYWEWERRVQELGTDRVRLGTGSLVDLGDGLTMRLLTAQRNAGTVLSLESSGGVAVLLDRDATRALAASGLEAVLPVPVLIVKLARWAGDPGMGPAFTGPARPQVLIVSGPGVPEPYPPEIGAEIYTVAARGTIELGWERGTGWLWTER